MQPVESAVIETYSMLFSVLGGQNQPSGTQFNGNTGAYFQIQSILFNGSQPSLPLSVQWQLNWQNQFVDAYQPTVARAIVEDDINLTLNPLSMYFWYPANPGPATSLVDFTCTARAADNSLVNGNATLSLNANPYRYAGGGIEGFELLPLNNGNTMLAFENQAENLPGFYMAFSSEPGAVYAGYLGAIQLLSGTRYFVGESGNQYVLSDTDGAYVLDASAQDQDYIYSKIEIEAGEIAAYTFEDSPGQELLPMIQEDRIVSFTVDETFQTYFVFNGSQSANPNQDNLQIWFTVAVPISWGWQVTVEQTGDNVWEIQNGKTIGPDPGVTRVLPVWDDTIRANADGSARRVRPGGFKRSQPSV